MESSSTPIRALIVGGRDRAQPAIRSFLDRYADIDVVGEYSGEREGLLAIRESSPDLVFIDLAMPAHGPFDAVTSQADRGRRHPYVICVTAREGLKRRTFSRSLDYLLKPLDESRFDQALARARTVLSHTRYAAMPRPDPRHTPVPSEPLERIAVQSRGQIFVLRVREIDWVKAEQDYVGLHVGSKSWLMRESLGALEARLAACGFVRIHRSTLVNVGRVRELRPLGNGEFTVVLVGGTELKLSRRFRGALPMIAGHGFS